MKKKSERKETSPDMIMHAITECQVKMNHAQRATEDLYEAIAKNDIAAAEKAIREGADVNAPHRPCGMEGGTPLDSAAFWAGSYNCSSSMINVLREYGATNYNLEDVKFLDDSDRCNTGEAIQRKKYLRKKKKI